MSQEVMRDLYDKPAFQKLFFNVSGSDEGLI
jgi:hypothetical protein